MQKLILYLTVTALTMGFYACSSSKKLADNRLTKNEMKKGYVLLFDGNSMNGWRGFRNQSVAAWSVENGALHCKGSEANYGDIKADLITKKKYKNFDFSVDYKISPKGNSGILYLVSEDSAYSFLTGPEYQIIDDEGFPEKLEDWQHTAANYAMDPAPDARPNPAGSWNHARIVKAGNHVEHWLNGKKVVEYELYSPDWENRKHMGKWQNTPGYGMEKEGYITFQNHGSEAWFKNVKIREL